MLQELLPRPLLHFIRGAVRVGDDHKLWQPLECQRTSGDLHYPVSNRTRLA